PRGAGVAPGLPSDVPQVEQGVANDLLLSGGRVEATEQARETSHPPAAVAVMVASQGYQPEQAHECDDETEHILLLVEGPRWRVTGTRMQPVCEERAEPFVKKCEAAPPG